MTNRRPIGGSNMAEAALKIETPIDPQAAAAPTGAGVRLPQFGLPKFEAADVFHELFELTCTTIAEGLTEYSAKVMEAMSANTKSAFELAHDLIAAKSLAEAAAVYSVFSRKQFDAFSAQAQELSALAQKVATDMTTPVTSGIPEMFKTAAASS
jgi:hypothetical protein